MGLNKYNTVADFGVEGQVVWPQELVHKIPDLQGLSVRLSNSLDQRRGYLLSFQGRWERSIQISSSSWKGKSLFVLINKLILAGVVFHVWQERNRRLFQSKRKQFWQVVADVEDDVRKKLQGLAVVKTSRVREELSRWGIAVE
ncbi:hypothetical protein AgCh_005984 [Apium graveolens]